MACECIVVFMKIVINKNRSALCGKINLQAIESLIFKLYKSFAITSVMCKLTNTII